MSDVGLAAPRRQVGESRDYLVAEFGEPEPGWLARSGAEVAAGA